MSKVLTKSNITAEMKFSISNGIKKNFVKLVLLSFLIMAPVLSFAQPVAHNPPCNSSGGKICNPLGDNGVASIPAFIKILLEGVLKVGIPIVALAIIYCGFLFVKAQGKPEELKKAKDAILYTLIGAAILLGSWAIARLISDTVLAL